MPGDVVVYERIGSLEVAHVALVLSVEPNIIDAEWSFQVLSQFGRDGEYVHVASEFPLGLALGGSVKLRVLTERDRSQ